MVKVFTYAKYITSIKETKLKFVFPILLFFLRQICIVQTKNTLYFK